MGIIVLRANRTASSTPWTVSGTTEAGRSRWPLGISAYVSDIRRITALAMRAAAIDVTGCTDADVVASSGDGGTPGGLTGPTTPAPCASFPPSHEDCPPPCRSTMTSSRQSTVLSWTSASQQVAHLVAEQSTWRSTWW